jgi:Protein of unknown function (DUF3237)
MGIAIIRKGWLAGERWHQEVRMANGDSGAPELEFVFGAQVTVDPPQDLGAFNKGQRRVVPITGGTFAGPNMRGTVVPGGADWQLIRHDGVAELDARYTLQTDDGVAIHVHNRALRYGPPDVMQALLAGRPVAPGSYYFRGVTSFTTDAESYSWLGKHIIVCTAVREPENVKLSFYRVL